MSDMPAAAAEIDLEGAVEAPLKGFIEPMLATLATNAFDDPDWLFEIKWDGYRLQAVVQDGKVRTFTRRGLDGATYFPGLLAHAVVDRRPDRRSSTARSWRSTRTGVPDFPLLQEAISESRSGSRGSGGTADGAAARRPPGPARLPGVRPALPRRPLAAPRPARGSEAAAPERPARIAARPLRLPRRGRRPGVLRRRPASAGSRASSPSSAARRYEPGRRTPAWLKIKIRPEQELVVGGWTPGEGNAKDLGALAVGVYEGDAAAVRRQGRLGVHRQRRGRSCGGGSRRSRRTAPPFDPAPERKGELRLRDVGPAGARDPGRARRLDPGRDRPPDRVQGHRRGPRPAGRDPGAGRSSSEEAAAPRRRSRMPDRRRLAPKIPTASTATARRRPRAAATPDERPATCRGRDGRRARRARGDAERGRSGTSAGRELKLTNLDKVAVRAASTAPASEPITKRELIALLRPDRAARCCRTSPSGRSTSSASRTAPARPGSGRRTSPRRRPTGCDAGRRSASTTATRTPT